MARYEIELQSNESNKSERDTFADFAVRAGAATSKSNGLSNVANASVTSISRDRVVSSLMTVS
jgi:hypothetical protein